MSDKKKCCVLIGILAVILVIAIVVASVLISCRAGNGGGADDQTTVLEDCTDGTSSKDAQVDASDSTQGNVNGDNVDVPVGGNHSADEPTIGESPDQGGDEEVNFGDPLGNEADNLAWCPVCEAEVKWTGITQADLDDDTGAHSWAYTIGDGHYYLTENISSGNKHTLGFDGNQAACLHLNDKNITASGEGKSAIFMDYPKSLNIMGAGIVSGVGSENAGAALYLNDTNGKNNAGVPVVNIYSGKFTKVAENTASAIIGIGKQGGEINMHGGQIGEGTPALTSANGAIHINGQNDKATFRLYGGTVYGTTTSAAGNASAVYVNNANALFEMYGGVVADNITDRNMIVANYGAVDIKKNAVLDASDALCAVNVRDTATGKITISGTVLGAVHSSSKVAESVILTGAPVVKDLSLTNRNASVLNAEGLTGGSVTVNEKSFITSAFKSKEAAETAMAFFVAPKGYELSVNKKFQIQQTVIPATENGQQGNGEMVIDPDTDIDVVLP